MQTPNTPGKFRSRQKEIAVHNQTHFFHTELESESQRASVPKFFNGKIQIQEEKRSYTAGRVSGKENLLPSAGLLNLTKQPDDEGCSGNLGCNLLAIRKNRLKSSSHPPPPQESSQSAFHLSQFFRIGNQGNLSVRLLQRTNPKRVMQIHLAEGPINSEQLLRIMINGK